MTENCSHLDQVRDVLPSADGCEDCLRIGATWVHLRLCMTCGHVGCCDSSPNRHATRHFQASQHPIIKSFQPGEESGGGWSYAHLLRAALEEAGLPLSISSRPRWRSAGDFAANDPRGYAEAMARLADADEPGK